MLVFDFVNNFSCANGGIGLLREIKDGHCREKRKVILILRIAGLRILILSLC